MANVRFDGSGVALITPFDNDGVNERVLADLVGFHHEEGTDALIVCGSTGEAATRRTAVRGLSGPSYWIQESVAAVGLQEFPTPTMVVRWPTCSSRVVRY